jgi:hypothetical protein
VLRFHAVQIAPLDFIVRLNLNVLLDFFRYGDFRTLGCLGDFRKLKSTGCFSICKRAEVVSAAAVFGTIIFFCAESGGCGVLPVWAKLVRKRIKRRNSKI